ncbi:MAG: phage tail protein [Patiriisocius sp.]|uniref:phage tail protein n=1 Tax=Patiriisocius sp. TaxID=2822396 RepID=UPI003EF0B2BC
MGQIQAFGFNFAPRGWALCEGQLLSIAQYNALFSLLGTQYGGDGRTTFGLPDLRGRIPLNQGQGPGLTAMKIGQKGGDETISLQATNIPAHSHPVAIPVNTGAGDEAAPGGQNLASHAGAFSEGGTAGQTLAPFNSGNNAGGNPVQSRNPYLVINYCIALEGIYPSRN